MITSIEITNLRGIAKGRLDGLAPLTILTGPNACGKSTVLDALLIVSCRSPLEPVKPAVDRHPGTPGGARWLFRADETEARLAARSDAQDREWVYRLKLVDRGENPASVMSPPSKTERDILVRRNPRSDERTSEVVLHEGDGLSAPVPFVKLVDTGLPSPLIREFTEAAESGRRKEVESLLKELLPGFERLEILRMTDEDYGVAITREGRSVPLALSGDGIQAIAQLALQIAVVPTGLVLIEEPETYQHPKALWLTARTVMANVRRGVQTVLTTHSLELIDALIAEATGADLDGMAVFNLAMVNGELRSGRRAGEEIRFARSTLENDLR